MLIQILLWVQAAFQGSWPSCSETAIQEAPPSQHKASFTQKPATERRAPTPHLLPLLSASGCRMKQGCCKRVLHRRAQAWRERVMGWGPSCLSTQGACPGVTLLDHDLNLLLHKLLLTQGPLAWHLSFTICSRDNHAHQIVPCAATFTSPS